LAGIIDNEAHLVSGNDGRLLGWRLLYSPRPISPGEFRAELVVDPTAEVHVVRDAVTSLVKAAAWRRPGTDSDSVVLVIGAEQDRLVRALTEVGFAEERRFAVEQRPLNETSAGVNNSAAAAASAGLEIVDWAEIERRQLGDEVRRLQFRTFAEHWGNLSKTAEEWDHHVTGPEFAPEFSAAVIDPGPGLVVAYVLGSRSRTVSAFGEQVYAHTDYIGVDAAYRRRGIAALLLSAVWESAVAHGVTTASLGVDVENSSNARGLYESLGYQTVGYHVAYRRFLE